MSVFDTSRPDDSNKRYQKALEAAITRKNNRRRLSEERAIAEESARVSSALEAITENVETPVTDTRRMTRRVLENKNKALQMLESRLIKEGYNTCFNNVIFGMVYESFWADDAVKESTVNQMYQTFTETLDLLESLGIKQIPLNKQNQFMQNVAELVTEACKKSAERIAHEAECNKDGKTSDDIETISFAMTDGEMNELDDNLAELSPEDITTLVKNKVLQVVQDEKECGKKKSDAFKEIDDEKVKIEIEYEDDDDDDEKDETDDMDEEKDKAEDTVDDMDDDDVNRQVSESASGAHLQKIWWSGSPSMTKTQAYQTISNLKSGKVKLNTDTGYDLMVAAKLTKLQQSEFEKIVSRADDKLERRYSLRDLQGNIMPDAETTFDQKRCVFVAANGAGDYLVYSYTTGQFYDFDHEQDSGENIKDWLSNGVSYKAMMNSKYVSESLSYRKLVNAAKTRKMHKQVGSSLFESIMMNSTNNVRTRLEASMESSIPDKKDVMDAAFMESMLVYTILETVQTVGLYSFSREDITKLKNHYKKFN